MDKSSTHAGRDTPQLYLVKRWLPWGLALLFALQIVLPYRGLVVLIVAIGATWTIAYVWSRVLARGLSLRREMRYGWAQVGDRLEERFTLCNEGWLPALWLELRDTSTLAGYSASRVTGLSAQSTSTWRVQGTCTRRGLFVLGPAILSTGDPFGIYTVRVPVPASATLVVTPAVVPLPDIDVVPGGRPGETRQGHRPTDPSVTSSRVREYRPGDSASRIHWRTSARRGELFARQFDSAAEGDWWIILDLNQGVQAGNGQDSTVEHAVTLAASLADRGLRAARNVGLIADGLRPIWLPPRRGAAQRWEITRALTFAETGTRSLGDVLRQARHVLRRSASLIVITPDVRRDWVPELLPALTQGSLPTILLLDPVSFGGDAGIDAVRALIAGLQMNCYPISRELLAGPHLHQRRQGQWEWRVSGTGRAIAILEPRDAGWRPVA